MEKTVVEKVRNHLEWIQELYLKKDPKRLLDEGFGFIEGIVMMDDTLEQEVYDLYMEICYNPVMFKKEV